MNKIEERKEFWIHSLQILNEIYICKYCQNFRGDSFG